MVIQPAAVAACLLLCTACDTPQPAVFGGETMGTVYNVTVADEMNKVATARLAQLVDGTLDAVNRRFSTYLEDSELSRFNRSQSTGWQPASVQLVAVLLEAQRVSALSNGLFDVTVGPLVNLWGFGPQPEIDDVPTANAIERALVTVGYHHLEVRRTPPVIRKRIPDLYVDLSAIAKGYAVDEVVTALTAAGVNNFLVDIGGELYAAGVNDRGQAWRVGIEKPMTPGRHEVLYSVPLSDFGIASSGDYLNYTEIDGRRYSHEINPYSGRPVMHRTALVSVVASSAMEADALATALLVMGSERGLEAARRHRISAYFVMRTEQGFATSASPEFEARFADNGYGD